MVVEQVDQYLEKWILSIISLTYIIGNIQYVLLSFFSLSITYLEIHLSCCAYQYFVPFYCWVGFTAWVYHGLFNHFSIDEHLVCSQLLAIMNKAAANISVYDCVNLCFHFPKVLAGQGREVTMRSESHAGSSRVSGTSLRVPESIRQPEGWMVWRAGGM